MTARLYVYAPVLLLFICFLVPVSSHAAEQESEAALFNKDGYRSNHYRNDTPKNLDGARVLTASEVFELTKSTASSGTSGIPVLVDVLSAGDVEPDPFDGSWQIENTHLNIPGSVWLPNVGRGYLDDVMLRYFESHLARITQNDKDRHIIFYCVEDCWMGWNAARRALHLGYAHVSWFPGGMTTWEEKSYPAETAVAVPVDME